MECMVQFTYNNSVDIPSLATQIHAMTIFHATLYTLLEHVYDAKKEERDKRRAARYGPQRPVSRTRPPSSPLMLPLPPHQEATEDDEIVPANADEYLEARRRIWPGYKVPTCSDNNTLEQW